MVFLWRKGCFVGVFLKFFFAEMTFVGVFGWEK